VPRRKEVPSAAQVTFCLPQRAGTVAAAIGVPVATPCAALARAAQLQAGETILIIGAGGAVEQAATQIGKRKGARVIRAGRGPGDGPQSPWRNLDRRRFAAMTNECIYGILARQLTQNSIRVQASIVADKKDVRARTSTGDGSGRVSALITGEKHMRSFQPLPAQAQSHAFPSNRPARILFFGSALAPPFDPAVHLKHSGYAPRSVPDFAVSERIHHKNQLALDMSPRQRNADKLPIS
jgi:hypothetical protein